MHLGKGKAAYFMWT